MSFSAPLIGFLIISLEVAATLRFPERCLNLSVFFFHIEAFCSPLCCLPSKLPLQITFIRFLFQKGNCFQLLEDWCPHFTLLKYTFILGLNIVLLGFWLPCICSPFMARWMTTESLQHSVSFTSIFIPISGVVSNSWAWRGFFPYPRLKFGSLFSPFRFIFGFRHRFTT